jgi:hypothetical protein
MARRRMIDPNFWQSEDISKLSIIARYIFIGMISNADDEGKGRANTNYLKSTIFPYDDIRSVDVDKALLEISHNTSVVLYEHSGNKYYKFVNWSKWQRVDKPQKSVLPDLSGVPELVENDSGIIPELVENDYGVKEVKRSKDNISKDNISIVFDNFWDVYPKKKSKGKAELAWNKIKPSQTLCKQIIDAVSIAKKSAEWKKEKGKFIPYPATWLNGKSWLDEYVIDIPEDEPVPFILTDDDVKGVEFNE